MVNQRPSSPSLASQGGLAAAGARMGTFGLVQMPLICRFTVLAATKRLRTMCGCFTSFMFPLCHSESHFAALMKIN
jgi:hypothetical protein